MHDGERTVRLLENFALNHDMPAGHIPAHDLIAVSPGSGGRLSGIGEADRAAAPQASLTGDRSDRQSSSGSGRLVSRGSTVARAGASLPWWWPGIEVDGGAGVGTERVARVLLPRVAALAWPRRATN